MIGEDRTPGAPFAALGLTVCDAAVMASPWPRAVRADCDGDGATGGVTDAVVLLVYSFLGGDEPPCLAACDADGDGSLGGVTDAVFFLTYNFLGGAPPPAPFPDCGPLWRETDAALGCLEPPCR